MRKRVLFYYDTTKRYEPRVLHSRPYPGVTVTLGEGVRIDREAALGPFEAPNRCPGDPDDLAGLTVADVRRLLTSLDVVYTFLDRLLTEDLPDEVLIRLSLRQYRQIPYWAEQLRTTLRNLMYDVEAACGA